MDHNGKQAQSIVFLALMAGTVVLAYFIFQPYLVVVILSAVSAILFRPMYRKILKIFGGHESLAAFAVALVAILAITVPLALFAIVVSDELVGTYQFLSAQKLGDFFEKVSGWVSGAAGFDIKLVAADLNGYIRSIFEYLIKNIFGIFSNVANLLVQILIFVFSLFYLLRDGDKIKKFLVRLSPMSDAYDEEILARLTGAVKSIIGGYIIIAFLQGLIIGFGFYIFGAPNPVIWGSMAAIASVIPFLGTAVVSVPAIVYLFAIGQIAPAIGLLIWSATTVHVADNILGPKLIGRGMKINGLLVMVSVFGGLTFFGPLGFLFGPLVLALLCAELGIYEKEYQDYICGS